MNRIVLFSLLYVSLQSYAQDKKMCITVDDLPAVTNGISGYDFKHGITESLVSVFSENKIPAIGYVNESKLYKNGNLDSSQVRLLEMWLQNGLELGNHTYSHKNYHNVSFEQYTADILRGEKVIKGLVKRYNTEINYFRHPYLRSGLSKSHSDSLTTFLKKNEYIEAPVTIDNDDYLFAAAYSYAYKANDTKLMESIGRDYIQYMEEKLIFFEKQSVRLFNRSIDQILLIHANYLNAKYMNKLINMYRKHNYTFVSQSEVLKDTVYKNEVTKFGDWGISWIDRWALSKGKKGDFFEGDPKTPEYIRQQAKRK